MSIYKDRMNIMLQLLTEVDSICRKHNLKYSISGELAKTIVNEKRLPDTFPYISIAMTSGDIDRFKDIIEREQPKDRYFEYIGNNPNAIILDGGFRYGNSATTMVSVSTFGNSVHYGIFIYIIEVRMKMSKPKKIKYMEKVHRAKRKESGAYSGARKTISNAIKKTITDERDAKMRHYVYNYFRDIRGIDTWDDIKSKDKIVISGTSYNNAYLDLSKWDIVDVEADGYKFMHSPMVGSTIIGNSSPYQTTTTSELWDVQIPYSEALKLPIIENIKKANKARLKSKKILNDGKEPILASKKAWETYEIAKQCVDLEKNFNSAMDANDIDMCDKVVSNYIAYKDSCTSRNYPFFNVETIEKYISEGK